MIKAIIFDMDGLIFDSEPVAYQATFDLLKEYNIEYKGRTDIFLGLRNVDIMNFFKKQYKIKDTVSNMLKRKHQIFFKYGDKIKLMPGFNRIKKLVEKNEWSRALATSGEKVHANYLLKKHGLTNWFKVKVTGDMVAKGKPDPETYLKAAKKLRIKPEDCLVLEDSPNGLLSAKQAGMKCIVVRGKGSRKLKFPQADAIVSSLSKINITLINKL